MLVIFSFLFLFALGSAFYSHTYSLLRQKEENHIEDMISQMYEQVSDATESTVYYAGLISTNTYAQNALSEKDPAANYENTKILFQIVPGITQNNPSVQGVMLLNLQDVFIGFNKRYYFLADELDQEYSLYSPDVNYTGFTGIIGENCENGPFYIYIQPIFQTSPNQENFTQKIGTCLILNTTKEMQSIIDQINIPENAYFMVLNDNDQLIASNDPLHTPEILSSIIPFFDQSADGKLSADIIGQKCLLLYRTVSSTGWRIVSVIPEETIYKELYIFWLFVFSFLILIIVIFSIWYHQVSHNILLPIYSILDFISKGAEHNLHHRMPISANNELGLLTEQINVLLNEIEELTSQQLEGQRRLYQSELEKKKAELSALQSQINPHFLYNTLENLKGFGYTLHSREIVEITNSLSFIMRYCIKGAETVCLYDELNCVKKYLNIISIRFEDRIRYEFDIPDEILNAQLPRFILQPIVENAVYHGLETIPDGGLLQISARRYEDFLLIMIKDNGVGIPKKMLSSLRKQLSASSTQDTLQPFGDRSIGLININNRLRVLYGPKYHITIESAPNQGTTVSATMPWIPSKNGIDSSMLYPNEFF